MLTCLSDNLKLHGGRAGIFRCECGTEKVLKIQNVLNGIKSCGCLRRTNRDKHTRPIGSVIGRLTITSNDFVENGVRMVRASCACGSGERIYKLRNLTSGNVKSCGCWRREFRPTLKHGHSGDKQSSEFSAWMRLHSICYNPNNRYYKHYGALGITMADEWRDSFEAFFMDMGPRPKKDWSIERIDKSGNFSKDNCLWSETCTMPGPKQNKILLERDGVAMTPSQWARILGIKPTTIYGRIARGWSTERILMTHPK